MEPTVYQAPMLHGR